MKPKAFYAEDKLNLYIIFTLFSVYFIRLAFFPSIISDEQEQIQNLSRFSLGYPGNPPLPTWIIFIFLKSFGNIQVALKLFHAFFLFLSLYTWKNIVNSTFLQKEGGVAFLTILLFPTFWQVCLEFKPHTLMALFAALQTYWWVIRNTETSNSYWYFVLGLLVGIGALSKFTYFIFLFTLILFSISTKKRQFSRLKSPCLIYSISIGAILSLPYYMWLLNHPTEGLSHLHKLHSIRKIGILGQPMTAVFSNLGLFFVYSILSNGYKNILMTVRSFCNSYFLSLVFCGYFLGLLMHITHFKGYYILPAAIFSILFQKENMSLLVKKPVLYRVFVLTTSCLTCFSITLHYMH